MTPGLDSERLLAIVQTQSEIAATALDVDAVMALVVRRARELLCAAAGVIELVDGEEMVYHVASGAAEPHLGLRLRRDSSLSGLCVALGETLHCADARIDPRVDADACRRVGAMCMLCVPLDHNGRTVGVLKVYDPRPNLFEQRDLQTLELLSAIIAAHMAHAAEYEEQQHASEHDALTGLPNRRSFDARLASESSRLRRHGGELAVCLLDLNRFKHVNDTLGHAAGDEALRAVARHLGELRGEDAAFRFGGDEFALLLVGASEEGASSALARLAEAVRTDPACHGVTLAWGIAMLSNGDAGAALARADAALYSAKEPARR